LLVDGRCSDRAVRTSNQPGACGPPTIPAPVTFLARKGHVTPGTSAVPVRTSVAGEVFGLLILVEVGSAPPPPPSRLHPSRPCGRVRDWDVTERHSIPLRGTSGRSPGSIRPQNVFGGRTTIQDPDGKHFLPDPRFSRGNRLAPPWDRDFPASPLPLQRGSIPAWAFMNWQCDCPETAQRAASDVEAPVEWDAAKRHFRRL